MFQRRPRKFRHRSNNRGYLSRDNGKDSKRLGSNSFSNIQTLNNFRTSLSAEKLFEKYNVLASLGIISNSFRIILLYYKNVLYYKRVL